MLPTANGINGPSRSCSDMVGEWWRIFRDISNNDGDTCQVTAQQFKKVYMARKHEDQPKKKIRRLVLAAFRRETTSPENYVISLSVNTTQPCASPSVSSWPPRPQSAPSPVSAKPWRSSRRCSYTAGSCASTASSTRRCACWAIPT